MILLALAALSAVFCSADSRWRYYGAYNNVTKCIAAGDEVFAVSEGSVFSLSAADSEVRTFDKTTGLSDVDISLAAYSKEQKCLILVYSNSNIDLLYPDEMKVAKMPQLRNSSISDKTVNDITVSNSKAVIAFNSGVSVIDLKKAEFSATYNFGFKVHSAVIAEGKLWAATVKGLYWGSLTDNLNDLSKWQSKGGEFTAIRLTSYGLYGLSSHLYNINTTSADYTAVLGDFHPTFISLSGDGRLYFVNSDAAYVLSGATEAQKIYGKNAFSDLTSSSQLYWAAEGRSGLHPYKSLSDGTLQSTGSGITLNSPVHNYCAFMNVTPSGKVLVSGGTMNYNNLNYPGTLYRESAGKFYNFEDSIQAYTGYMYRNLTGAAEDPSDPEHVFASSSETGLYEFRSGKFVKHYDNSNSPLASVLPDDRFSSYYVRIGGLKYDASGNLWMLNFETDTILRVLMKDGSWKSIYIDELAKYPTFDHILFDSAGRLWFTHRRTTNQHFAGLACLDFGGTVGNVSDDKFRFRYRFTNEDGTTYTPNTVDAIAMDNDGRIWVGTVEGPFLIDNPSDYFASDFTFDQVKVPRNDGTDYADYLLTGVPVTAIAVDKANRKWFGTKNDGLYLISADNIETIEHFTSSNSPLVSDYIQSLAFDPASGLLMIGTDKGLMSYDPGKVTGNDSKFKDDDLKIYPNPVRPDYYGDVTIEGLPYGAEVKITSAGGQLIRKGVSNSGIYKWDVKDSHGAGVGSGVYYVLAVTANGKHGARGRITVIR